MDSISTKTLRSRIAREIGILDTFISVDPPAVSIHINKSSAPDYPRAMFVLFSLARASRFGFVPRERVAALRAVFWSLYDEAKVKGLPKDMLYVDLYGMRFLAQLGDDATELIDSFAARPHANLFTYPVLTYIYVSAYLECKALRTTYPFSTNLFYESRKVFEYWLRSSDGAQYLPFHFSEVSAWTGHVDDTLLALAASRVERLFDAGYLSRTDISASGVAKCMEHFARRQSSARLGECEAFLAGRRLSRFGTFVRPDQAALAHSLFTERADSQYLCLDTSAHRLHAFCNLYETL